MRCRVVVTSLWCIGLSVSAGVGPATEAGVPDYAAALAGWGDSLELYDGVVEQIERYSAENHDLGRAYAEALAADVRRLVFGDAALAMKGLPTVPGEPVVEVEYLEPGFAVADGNEPDAKHQREFEEGFIRIESLAFIEAEGVTPAQALALFTSPRFRMDVSHRIERIWEEGGLSCIEVGGVTAIMAPTQACNRTEELVEAGLAAQHSQVVANPGGDDFQTVYFKESLKSFVAVEGGLAYHYINYTRTVKLGALKRTFGRGRIEASEKDKIRELQRRLLDGE
jgi:hypothetical protein